MVVKMYVLLGTLIVSLVVNLVVGLRLWKINQEAKEAEQLAVENAERSRRLCEQACMPKR
jgi:hypothetical protein